MSKTITSPIARWQGTVTLSEPLTLPQAEAIEQGLEPPKDIPADGLIFNTVNDKRVMPAIFACVEKWELKDFPVEVNADNFPFSPRGESHKLIDWLFGEIFKIYTGESEVPNE